MLLVGHITGFYLNNEFGRSPVMTVALQNEWEKEKKKSKWWQLEDRDIERVVVLSASHLFKIWIQLIIVIVKQFNVLLFEESKPTFLKIL